MKKCNGFLDRLAFLSAAVLFLFLLTACGSQDSFSRSSEVGTDLGEGDGTYMYWLEGQDVVQGQCAFGVAVIRANCERNKKFIPYLDFENHLLTPPARRKQA